MTLTAPTPTAPAAPGTPAAPAAAHRPAPWARLLPEPGPQRVLAAATVVNTFGSGLFVASSALYFTRVVGLPTGQVALGLTAGGVTGLFAGLAGGRIADRWGARRTQIGVMLLGAAFTTGYLFVRGFWPFLAVACLTAAVHAANPASRDPLVRAFGGTRPAAFRAYLQAVTNLALSLGAVLAGLAVQADTRGAYTALLVGRVLAFLACALVLARLPRPAPRAAGADRPRSGWTALRNRPFLVATAANGLLELHYSVPAFALPLWIVGHTSAPRWTTSAVLLLNTGLIAAFQVRAARDVTGVDAAGRRLRWAGGALAAALLLTAAAEGPPWWAAALLLTVATAVYTAGELWHAAASMEYSFGFAEPGAQGQYSGVFGFGAGLGDALGPAVLGVFVLSWGRPGWLLLAALLLAVGTLTGPLVTRAARPGRRAGAGAGV
ncbi:MFS transporter [Kitasatospora sp. NPDC048538]|uniref:MFS transporter n=1 Tax=unclassified Kitasatospora TaxID=2633591 RepID=UPI0033F35369